MSINERDDDIKPLNIAQMEGESPAPMGDYVFVAEERWLVMKKIKEEQAIESQEKNEQIKVLKAKLNEDSWIIMNEQKEKINKRVFDFFEKSESTWQLKVTLAGFLNGLFDDIPSKIVPSDFDSIEFVKNPPELIMLNKVTNSNFRRFYIKLSLKDIKNLSYKLQWYHSASGMNIPFSIDNIDASLIVSPQIPNFLIHELAHSIDPYMCDRTGKNKILDECIGYYTEILYPRIVTTTINWGEPTRKVIESNLMHIKGSISDQTYRKQMELDKEMSYDEYKKAVEQTLNILQGLENKIGKEALFRKLLNAKAIEDLTKGE